MTVDLDVALKVFGGCSGLARALRVSPGTVYRWKKTGLPSWREWQIEQLMKAKKVRAVS